MNKITINGKNIYQAEGNIVNGKTLIADMIRLDERFFHILQEGKSFQVEVVNVDKPEKMLTLKVNGSMYEIAIKDKFDQLIEELGFGGGVQNKMRELRAPMPGLVIDIRVKAGDAVQKGDAVIVLEAMKMENVLKAAGEGIVKSIEVAKGVSVEKNQVLLIFE